MQKGYRSKFEDIFRTNFQGMYSNTKESRKLRWLIINMMRVWFIEVWVKKVVQQVKDQVLTSVNNQESELKDNGIRVLNDNDVNKMFGWALFKLKKKTQKELFNR